MMRVVHVMASGERGGGADHLAGLMPELRRRGVECVATVGAQGPLGDRLEVAGFRVARMDLMGSRVDPHAILRLRTALHGLRPDLVHCHGTRAGFMVTMGMVRKPWIYTIHGLSYRQSASFLRRGVSVAAEAAICRRADEVVSVSALDLEDLRRRRVLSDNRGVYVPNAVDTGRFRPRDRTVAKRRLGVADHAFVLGVVARLVPQKGVEDLISAASLVPDVTLALVGDGPLRGALERQARIGRVKALFLGARDDVHDVLPAFDVFVLPSRWEGEPIALLEAMATGLPCVATATSGSREVLREPGLGVLVPLQDPIAIATAVTALRADPARRGTLGSAARVAVERRSWGATALRVVDVYERVIARRA